MSERKRKGMAPDPVKLQKASVNVADCILTVAITEGGETKDYVDLPFGDDENGQPCIDPTVLTHLVAEALMLTLKRRSRGTTAIDRAAKLEKLMSRLKAGDLELVLGRPKAATKGRVILETKALPLEIQAYAQLINKPIFIARKLWNDGTEEFRQRHRETPELQAKMAELQEAAHNIGFMSLENTLPA